MHEYDGFSDEVLCALGAAAGEDDVLMVEPMREHTTFKIGGPADVLVTPHTDEALVKVLNICSIAESPVLVVGNGSDLLVSDRGVRGAVVLLRDNFAGIEVDAERGRVTAQAEPCCATWRWRRPTPASRAWSRSRASPPRWVARAS